MPTKYADVRGFATFYYYIGKTTLPDVIPDFSRGRKIVFLHAAGSNGHAWHHQYDHMGKAHSPIAPDLPGHGRTSGVEGLASVGDYADFTAAFFDALKIDSAVIAGRSMGGAIAMDFALRYPDRVQALILMATAAKFNIPSERIEIWRGVTMGRSPQPFTKDGYSPKTPQEVIQEGWMEQIRTDPRVRWMDMAACAKFDVSEHIAGINRPTLILAGADDTITPPADAEFIQGRIRASQLKIIPDAAHNLTTEKPAEVNAAIDGFLAALK